MKNDTALSVLNLKGLRRQGYNTDAALSGTPTVLVDLYNGSYQAAEESETMYVTELCCYETSDTVLDGTCKHSCFAVFAIAPSAISDLYHIKKLFQDRQIQTSTTIQAAYQVMVVELYQCVGGDSYVAIYGNDVGEYGSRIQVRANEETYIHTSGNGRRGVFIRSDRTIWFSTNRRKYPFNYLNGWKYMPGLISRLIVPVLYAPWGEQHHLWRDICRDAIIDCAGTFAAIKTEHVWQAHSKQALLRMKFPKLQIPRMVNTMSLADSIAIIMAGKLINNIELAFQMRDKLLPVPLATGLAERSVGATVWQHYFERTLCDSDPDEYAEMDLQYIISDYINGCKRVKQPIYAKIASVAQLIKHHNRVAERIIKADYRKSKMCIPKNSRFNNVRLPQYFEKITTKARLLSESTSQNHCVFTYLDKINADKCAIYSVLHEGARYTCEITASKQRYVPAQIRGQQNSPAPDSLWDIVLGALDKCTCTTKQE